MMDWFHILLLGSTVFLGALAALAAFVATDKARALEKLCGTLRNERDAARRRRWNGRCECSKGWRSGPRTRPGRTGVPDERSLTCR